MLERIGYFFLQDAEKLERIARAESGEGKTLALLSVECEARSQDLHPDPPAEGGKRGNNRYTHPVHRIHRQPPSFPFTR